MGLILPPGAGGESGPPADDTVGVLPIWVEGATITNEMTGPTLHILDPAPNMLTVRCQPGTITHVDLSASNGVRINGNAMTWDFSDQGLTAAEQIQIMQWVRDHYNTLNTALVFVGQNDVLPMDTLAFIQAGNSGFSYVDGETFSGQSNTAQFTFSGTIIAPSGGLNGFNITSRSGTVSPGDSFNLTINTAEGQDGDVAQFYKGNATAVQLIGSISYNQGPI